MGIRDINGEGTDSKIVEVTVPPVESGNQSPSPAPGPEISALQEEARNRADLTAQIEGFLRERAQATNDSVDGESK